MKRCSISPVIQNLHIKTTIKYHYISIKMAKFQHTNKYKVPTRMWSSRNSHSFPVGMQNGAVQLLWKTGWQLLMKLNTVLPHGPTTVLLGITQLISKLMPTQKSAFKCLYQLHS